MRYLPNPYPGINAHHNSWLQANTAQWMGFHSLFIAEVHRFLNPGLFALGYRARVEQSLQIQTEFDTFIRPRADILIVDDSGRGGQAGALAPAPSLPLTAMVDFDAEDLFSMAIILTRDGDSEPVAWLEILSPSNKPPHSGFEIYAMKRRKVLESGIVFIEVDFLHEQSPAWDRPLPDYTRGDPQAFPYRIAVATPRPTALHGTATLYNVAVSLPLPTITIPLLGADRLEFDLNAPYQKLFTEAYYGADVDYSLPPAHIERYHPDDQRYIRERMAFVAQATATS